MADAFICDYVRTPIGRFGGALSAVRTDDLAAVPIKALMDRNNAADWNKVDEVVFGCANQAGEDNRNVARMAVLLAGLPQSVPAMTRSRPTIRANRSIRSATSSGCSMMFVQVSIVPGMRTLSSGIFVSAHTRHSCSWRGLAASNSIACGLAFRTMSMMCFIGMSKSCGPS